MIKKREDLAESNLQKGEEMILKGEDLIQEANSKTRKAELLQSRANKYHESYLELCTTKTAELKEREKKVSEREKENKAKEKLLSEEKSKLEIREQKNC